VPGIVDIKQRNILVTPNINLNGFPLADKISKKFRVRVFIENDVNLGLLGEKWQGAGRKANNILGIFPGTGVGGAVIIKDDLYRGAKGAAAEIGHMIMDLDGPICSCGNRGCLEALASRWAIERDIRLAIKNNQKTIVTKLISKNSKNIKSRVIKQALDRRDPVVVKIMTHASEVLGSACISLRHIFNPELIIFGGGLIEACSGFMIPIIQRVSGRDPFFSKFEKCKIVTSQLEDNAVILGAVEMVKRATG
jgi:glucokinase